MPDVSLEGGNVVVQVLLRFLLKPDSFPLLAVLTLTVNGLLIWLVSTFTRYFSASGDPVMTRPKRVRRPRPRRATIKSVSTAARSPVSTDGATPKRVSWFAVDAAIGASTVAVEASAALSRRGTRVARPLARLALRPPLLPTRYQPASSLAGLARLGAGQRLRIERQFASLLDVVVPALLAELLGRLDLTSAVKQYVDLDAIVAEVDLDAAAARLDVDAVAGRLDLDAAAAQLDVDAVAGRLDLDAVLERLDLTAIVLERVDLDVLVSAVLERIDVVGMAEEVIAEIDLPEIIRESTGSMASETVRGARMQGIAGDEALRRVVDRLLLRREQRPRRMAAAGTIPEQRDSAALPRQP